MPRQVPTPLQNLLSSVLLPLLSLALIPVSLAAVVLCLLRDRLRGNGSTRGKAKARAVRDGKVPGGEKGEKGCVIISGGRMSKGLTLARAFKRAGWKVIGVEEEGWGNLCPLRFSSSIHQFHLLPPISPHPNSYTRYSSALISIAKLHSATLFIPVSGAGSSVEDSRAADEMFKQTGGRCKTWIQDVETMRDLHDKDRFAKLVGELGFAVPAGAMVSSLEGAMEFLRREQEKERAKKGPRFILKCMGLDENRGDMTLYPVLGVGEKRGESRSVDMVETRRRLRGLKLAISEECPYVFQEFIPGQEYCTHASVSLGTLTSFVACPSNDMLMTYENITTTPLGSRFEQWTKDFLSKLQDHPTPSGDRRRLTGHFSFDFIVHERTGEIYPLECNARVHTASILLPLDKIAQAYAGGEGGEGEGGGGAVLRPKEGIAPRSWWYNDLIMRYLPLFLSSQNLERLHPCLPACKVPEDRRARLKPSEEPCMWRVDPTLVADDWVPFLVLWHVWWPALLVKRWWQGKKWTRLNVSTGRIFEA